MSRANGPASVRAAQLKCLSHETGSPQDDPRVVEALEQYLVEVESGHRPDPRDFLARHAEIADALAPCLASMDFLCHAVGDPGKLDEGPPIDLAARALGVEPHRRLGDFRILRELGRGGMGVVYEAEQTSLGRRVALKVLPFASTLDPRQLLRFQTEAQAAAHLHHPHIVPVYSVGSEQGVPYYAMQFIEGQTLADLIRRIRRTGVFDPSSARARRAGVPHVTAFTPAGGGAPATDRHSQSDDQGIGRPATKPWSEPGSPLPQPNASPFQGGRAYYRFVARLAIQASQALQHAHGFGILHRDIKPANLLVDERGNLWVTDFGLARVQGGSGITLTGDLVGTIRYMSPEQVLGRRAVIDHRADIYSLGATLYELLTLRPIFLGGDRQELLRQIATLDPPAPRRVNKSIPRDLETIVLKAAAKEPESRYGCARDLAEDLERFLRDEPILARRPTVVERSARWSWRHRRIVASTVFCFGMAVVGLSAGMWQIWREKLRAETAYLNEDLQRHRAQENVKLALEALEHLYLRVADRRSRQDVVWDREDRELMRVALGFYRQFANQNGDLPKVRWLTAQAHERVGDIQAALGQVGEAEAAYRKSITMLEALWSEFPKGISYRIRAGAVYHSLATLLHSRHREADAETAVRRALEIQERMAAELPMMSEYRRETANRLNNLGAILEAQGKLPLAETAFRRAMALRQDLSALFPDGLELRHDLAVSHSNLGGVLLAAGRLDEARGFLERAVSLHVVLTKEFPTSAGYRRELARTRYNLGLVLFASGHLGEAETATKDALEVHKELAELFPASDDERDGLARAYHSLGLIQSARNQPSQSEQALREAVKLREQIDPESGSSPSCREELAKSYVALGRVLNDANPWLEADRTLLLARRHDPLDSLSSNNMAWYLALRPEPSPEELAEAVALAMKAVKLAPRQGVYWNTLGVAQYRAGNCHEAVKALTESMRLRDGGSPHDWFVLAMVHWRLGQKGEAQRWYNRSVAAMGDDSGQPTELRMFRDEAAATLGIEG